MNSKIEIKNIFYNRLYNKKKSNLSNNNSISSTKVNNSFDNPNISKINQNLYFKPRPIYIIPNKNENSINIGTNIYKPKKNILKNKKPQEIETYEVSYNDGNVTLKKINTERIKHKYKKINENNNINNYKINGYRSLRGCTNEINSFNYTLNNNFYNYKKNYKLFRLNTYNFNNSNILYDNNIENANKTLDTIYKAKKIKKNNKILNIKELNNNFFNFCKNNKKEKNEVKQKSSKSTDIVTLCKIIKDLDHNKIGNNFNEDNNNIIIIDKNKDIKYKKYLKWIIIIQKYYKRYMLRKKFIYFLNIIKIFNKPKYLKKIILIQKYWKNYLIKIKQNNFNFSFNNDNNNLNIKNNIKEIKEGNKNNECKSKKIISKYFIPYRSKLNHCFITKKYYNNFNQQIESINLITKIFKKYLMNKNKKQNENSKIIYLKKNVSIKTNKSRNKKKLRKKNLNIINPLSIISYKKEYYSHSFNTPRKEKISNKKKLLKESTYSSMFYKLNYKEIFSRNDLNINMFIKYINNICYISKIRKTNFLNKIIFLQNETKKYLFKNKYITYMHIKVNVCYITKQINTINNKLNNKIILLQKNIKNYIKNKFIYKIMNKNNNSIFSDNKYNFTNYISDEKKYNENSENKYISDFNINEYNNNDFLIIDNNNKEKEKNNNRNKLEASFIAKNVVDFSFDFKENYNEIYKNIPSILKGNNNNILIDDINDNNENIQEEEDDYFCSNKINNFKNFFSFSHKNKLYLTNEKNKYYIKLRNIFITRITNKLSLFLILLLNRINVFNFIKILSQKIKKYINQYLFYNLFSKLNEKDTVCVKNNNKIFFFRTLKRHILYNLKNNENDNNQIKKLLKDNIPKCFRINGNMIKSINNNYNINIPYINQYQENKLINENLFVNDNDNLIKYFIGFYNNEKKNNDINALLLKNTIIFDNLKNRNLFGLTKYIDNIYYNIIHTKNGLFFNKDCIYRKQNLKEKNINKIKIKNNFNNISNNFSKEIDEEISNEKIDKKNSYKELFNKTYKYYSNTLNQNNYKFIDYINEKNKNQFNATLPGTSRDISDSFIKDKI